MYIYNCGNLKRSVNKVIRVKIDEENRKCKITFYRLKNI